MKVLSVGGTRPQFVKMAVLVKAIDEYNRLHPGSIEHRLIHTGQHSDPMMSAVFFEELGLPKPRLLEAVRTGTPGIQTAVMLASIEAELLEWPPDALITYGDTNSTIASALAAAKLHIPVIHLEAGLRSFNRMMQEEINRVVTDHVSDLLLCPTHNAVEQLKREGLGHRAVFVGDVMLDAIGCFGVVGQLSSVQRDLGLGSQEYALVTIHRAETTDDPSRLAGILEALKKIDVPIIFPMHPRLRKQLAMTNNAGLFLGEHVHIVEPVGYLEMLALQQNARFIMTDSGGLQKEAYFMGVPCLTLRNETEWIETLHGGWNLLVGNETQTILDAARRLVQYGRGSTSEPRKLVEFGEGKAGERSVDRILEMVRAA
ncbi:non-hydrolyzing UDP-N-acetylglucosamine 2-epimerase [Terriglobus tenax]|uniref:non-hydrolyzing UDP-N-acetylglucosamine 2-epimerase n=1 Tax=Terriglobus tenax TaxID=1111115 RepID=UPI0021E09A8F|nr:UDP-N-acetylglucosamine 2-epimerase (non-hydrolyzing) [Terriglobus tenax]